MEVALSPTYAPTKAQSTEYDVKKNMHKRGQCSNCGIQTHKVMGLFNYSLVPLTNSDVRSGRCLLCQPLSPASASAPPRLVIGEVHGVSVVAIPSGDEDPLGLGSNEFTTETENDPPAPVPRNSWWKEHQRLVIGGFVFIFVAVASAILGVVLNTDTPKVLGNATSDVLGNDAPDVLGNATPDVLGNNTPDVGGTNPSPPPTTQSTGLTCDDFGIFSAGPNEMCGSEVQGGLECKSECCPAQKDYCLGACKSEINPNGCLMTCLGDRGCDFESTGLTCDDFGIFSSGMCGSEVQGGSECKSECCESQTGWCMLGACLYDIHSDCLMTCLGDRGCGP